MERVEAAHRFDVPVERAFVFITDTANWPKYWPGYRLVVEYEPRAGIAGWFDRMVLTRGIRRAFRSTFAALERVL